MGWFLSVDPLAADFAAWSTYNYVLGNPIIFIDPDGRSVEPAKTVPTYNVLPTNPTIDNDLGHTGFVNANWKFNNSTKSIDVTVSTFMTLSPQFDDTESEFSNNNPGLKEDTRFHEDEHVNQIMDIAREPLTCETGSCGGYSGRVDEVMTEYMGDLITKGGGSKKFNADKKFQAEVTSKLNAFMEKFNTHIKKEIKTAKATKDMEADANRRAIAAGHEMPYATGKKTIKFKSEKK